MIRRWIDRGETHIHDGLLVHKFETSGLTAFVAFEFGRWHLSISARSGRYPTWDEIADARYDLLPDSITCVIVLPPRAQYVNVANVFHVWQTTDVEVAGGAPPEPMLRTYENGIVPE
jgi:hypothetical protein